MNAPVVLPPRHAVVIGWTWLAIALLLLTDVVWLRTAGIGFPHKMLHLILAASVFLFIVSVIYRTLRRDDAIWLGAQMVNQLVLGSCALATFNYLGLRLGYPLMDAQFFALDQRLGFDWLAYVTWVDHHPWIAKIFSLSYMATGPEVVAILAFLCFFQRFAQAHRYALGFLLGGMVTVSVAAFWPALSAYIYHGTNASLYPHLRIAEAVEYRDQFFAMRNHAMPMLPEDFQGLVAFPSFHSALAILAIVAARSMPVLWLRYAVIAINVLMLFSTPVDGGHYLVDTLSGIALGIVVAAVVARWVPEEEVP